MRPTLPQTRVQTRGMVFAASRSSVCGPPPAIRPSVPRTTTVDDITAHPSTSSTPVPPWVPVASTSGESEVQRLWCQSPETDHTWPLPPLVMHIEHDDQLTLHIQINEPPAPPGKQKHPDYYANVGDAIRTLREDIPQLFVKDLNCTFVHLLFFHFFTHPHSPHSFLKSQMPFIGRILCSETPHFNSKASRTTNSSFGPFDFTDDYSFLDCTWTYSAFGNQKIIKSK